jgi:hypothetical protein
LKAESITMSSDRGSFRERILLIKFTPNCHLYVIVEGQGCTYPSIQFCPKLTQNQIFEVLADLESRERMVVWVL